MFYTIALFGTLGIIETIYRSYQISGNTADLFKSLRFQIIAQIYVIPVKIQIYALYAAIMIFRLNVMNISTTLFLAQLFI